MPTVTFKFFGQLRDVVEGSSASVEVSEGSSLREALGQLGAKYGEPFRRRMFTSTGSVQDSASIFLNESPVANNELDRKLVKTDDEITILVMTAMQGGSEGRGGFL